MSTSAQAPSTSPETPHPWLTGRIVVGIDDSEQSHEAFRHAIQLSYVGGASLTLVSAWQYPVTYGHVLAEPQWDPTNEMRDTLQKLAESVFGDEIPESLTIEVREGPSAQVLIDASDDADLLVVGSRGHGGFSGLLLGSVSAACAEHASCPVLVVHESKTHTVHAARHTA